MFINIREGLKKSMHKQRIWSIEDFELGDRLGSGCYSEVYKVKLKTDDQIVENDEIFALKVIPIESCPNHIIRNEISINTTLSQISQLFYEVSKSNLKKNVSIPDTANISTLESTQSILTIPNVSLINTNQHN